MPDDSAAAAAAGGWRPLRIRILLEDTELSGGAKVAMQLGGLLSRRGHDVAVISRDRGPDWFRLECDFHHVDGWDALRVDGADVVVATFWTTLRPAWEAAGERVLHYCQGMEWTFGHNPAEHPSIRAAYALPLPAMTVTPHLAEVMQRKFGRPARVVSPPLDATWHPRPRPRPRRRPRVVVMQPFEIDLKGVATSLEAVRLLRGSGLPARLVRISQWPLSDAEREVLVPDEFHHRIAPARVARLLRGADLLLAASWEQEGFGLHVVEAMASGVPVVASDIPSFRFACGGAARLVPPRRPDAFADAAAEILRTAPLWRELRRRGLEASRRFSEGRVARAADAAVSWAASGAWRDELRPPGPSALSEAGPAAPRGA